MDLALKTRDDYLDKLAEIHTRWHGLEGEELIAAAVEEFGDRLAMTCSFGSESVVEAHMISKINPSLKILFLDTGKLFGETLRYRDLLIETLGLTNVISAQPDPEARATLDPKGVLWSSNPDLCCNFRKVQPQEKAFAGVDAIITGRKRFQTLSRQNMPFVDVVEKPEGGSPRGGLRWTINPLASWSLEQIHAYIQRYDLPQHPLVKEGYISIGCMPCTDRATEKNYRAGRWVGRDKEECGIHQDSFLDGGGI